MNSQQNTTAVVVLAGLLAATPCIVFGQGIVVVRDHVEVEHFATSTYINGGVGQAEQDLMKRLEGQFPLQITLSERASGQYIVNVPIVISDSKGKQVFELAQGGPLLDVMLPNGSYKVTAQFKGETQVQDVTLNGSGSKTLYFNWKDHD
jgi:hypothetical protein